MSHLFQSLSLVILGVLLTPSGFVVANDRAQAWKSQREIGSAQLRVSELDTIVMPQLVTKPLSAAIDDFSNLLEVRYGRAPQRASEGYPKNAIYFELVADGRKGDAFTIRRDRTRIVIYSSDEAGWCNALYAVMQTMLGARWYWAGDLGFELVPPTLDYFPNHAWRETPDFVQRRFYPVNSDFARRNRLNNVYLFNHNLSRVFNKGLFATNPEVFSEVNGRRKPPSGSAATDPQPNLAHSDSVEIAAQAALKHFAAHPESNSFSLSINDNVLFDTTEATESRVSPLRYFRGRPNYTDLVFGFMNRVAERVFDQGGAWQSSTGEDRYLTALSYFWTEPAPTIRIHPRVMPVLTSDRAQWHDPKYRAQDKALIESWVSSGAERVATWDYYFGAPYLYPRQFNQWIAESLHFMSEAGIDVFFSQLPSFWGLDGAKAWLGAELLWNSQQDAEALLAEYYDHFFGAASVPMRAFYETAERYRNEHEGQADWIKLYKDESGIALFTPEVLLRMRGFLTQAQQMLGGSSGGSQGREQGRLASHDQAQQDATRFQQRVHIVSDAFRLTELYAAFDGARRALVLACLDAESSEVIETRLVDFKQADAAYQTYFENYTDNADYIPNRRYIALGQSNPERLARGLLEPRPQSFLSFVQDTELKHLGQETRNFLGPDLPQLSRWNLDYRPSEFFQIVGSEFAQSGNAGLRISGADMVSVFSTFPVVSNQQYELHLQGSWRISLDNRVHIHTAWLDRNGRTLESGIQLRLPIEHRDEPTQIRLPFTAPNNAYDLRIRIVVSRQYPGDYLDLSHLDFGSVR